MSQNNNNNSQAEIIIKEQDESSKPLSKRAKKRKRKRRRKRKNKLSSREKLDRLIKDTNKKYGGGEKARSTFWDALSNSDKKKWEDFTKNLVKKDSND